MVEVERVAEAGKVGSAAEAKVAVGSAAEVKVEMEEVDSVAVAARVEAGKVEKEAEETEEGMEAEVTEEGMEEEEGMAEAEMGVEVRAAKVAVASAAEATVATAVGGTRVYCKTRNNSMDMTCRHSRSFCECMLEHIACRRRSFGHMNGNSKTMNSQLNDNRHPRRRRVGRALRRT